ncbi:MAG: hypothetical protein LBK60_03135 [Verrucomicrobiales bacterium]|jgi:hypothetical protein|nr:hypothetical protein [Verrucomicrobiales bacterium]
MSYQMFFELSLGLKKNLHAPRGTLKGITSHVAEVEAALGFKTERCKPNPARWNLRVKDGVSDETLCEIAEMHNNWVRGLYADFAKWYKNPVADGEVITPAQAQKFWRGMARIIVPPQRWTGDYYQCRMEELYAVMREHSTADTAFGAPPLTVRQAREVIILFSEFLDREDIRLDVPVGYDHLRPGDDYCWCSKCGAIAEEDVAGRLRRCRKRGGCDLRENYGDDYKD